MNPEPNTPPGEPLPDMGAEHVRHPRAQAQEQAIVSLGHRLRATRRLAQVAIGVALVGFVAALWVDSRSGERVEAIRTLTAEVEDLRSELDRVKSERKRVPVRTPPRGLNDDNGSDLPEIFGEPATALDIDVLHDRVTAVEAKNAKTAQELTSGLVEWGTETKSYVDRGLANAAEERRRESRQELTLVWDRIRQIEMRLPR